MSRLPPIISLFSAIVIAYFYALFKPLFNSLKKLNPCYNTPACQVCQRPDEICIFKFYFIDPQKNSGSKIISHHWCSMDVHKTLWALHI